MSKRKDSIRPVVQPLLARLPHGWQGWSADRLAQFKDDAALIQGNGGTMADLEAAAHRICAAYGKRATWEPAPEVRA